ncbi:MAG: 7-carboxy-7-deazaguanine synthase [Steroidobacteraceae bacterium]|nr:7-carboxy-7-deazaguanine synthase [Steroidobacteraceae bacterium]
MNVPATESRLKVTEIFLSLQGEAATVGFPTVFVRLTGCPLRCRYCDTTYAFSGGAWWSQSAVLAKVASFATRHVCVTGGEPLAQRACPPLLTALCDAGHVVSLETSGALAIAAVDPRVQRVVDVKTPGSGEMARNRPDDFSLLTAHDLIKFVITDRADYEWAIGQVRAHGLDGRCTVFFSPSHRELPARELAEWILADRAPVRFQIQLHKVLWGDEPGR